jgi:hypothetical protein
LQSKNINIKIHGPLNLLVVSYGDESCCPILTQGHRLQMLKNRFLRDIFGPKKEEAGGWRKLLKDYLHDL